MRIAVIGANGNLGRRVTKQALDRGIEVTGFIYDGESPDSRAKIIKQSLFEMNKESMKDCDAVISAYGSGFHADPTLNLNAFRKYIELCEDSNVHLIAIGGAGSLYTDESHTLFCYEVPDYSKTLKEISKNIKLGIDELKKTTNFNWTAVCPSQFFDPEGNFSGFYQIGVEGHLIFNEKGRSYVTYDDLAKAMIDIAEKKLYVKQQVTIVTKE